MHQRLASPGSLFHTQPFCWHVTTGTLSSCSLGTFLWFRITCGGNLLPSPNTSNKIVTQVILLFTTSYHMWQKSNKLLLQFCWQFMAQWSSSMKTQPIPLHHMHTTPTLALKLCHMMLCHLASSHFLTSKRYSTERFLFICFYFCFLHRHTFPFTMWNFLAAMQLFVFSAQLTIGLNCARNFAHLYSKCRWHL